MIWTTELVELLTDLWNVRGLTASQCAAQLGVTRNAVIGKASRLGLNGRKSPILPRLPASVARARRNELQRQRLASKPKQPKLRQPRIKRQPMPELPPAPQKPRGEAWDAIPGIQPVSLVDLEAGQCKWPIGQDSPYLFCGAPATHRHYCEHHHAWSVGNGSSFERAAIKTAQRAVGLERYVPDREAA